MKESVQHVADVGSGGTEGMAARSVALGQQMAILESAVKSNNPNLANQVLGSISICKLYFKMLFDSANVASGLKQQATLAKANAGSVQV